MGLDVSLYKCPNPKRAVALENAYEKELDALYTTFNQIQEHHVPTQEETDKFDADREKLREKYEIDGWHHRSRVQFHHDSKTNPEHLFKIGYMRSSYNSGGINSVARVFGLPDLYDIFDVTNDEYEQFHDWDTVYTDLKAAIVQWRAHADSPMGKYTIMTFRPNFERSSWAKSSQEALEVFNQEYLKNKTEIDKDEWRRSGWHSKYGHFYPEPLKVSAIIAKSWDPKKPASFLANSPETFLIIERDNNDTLEWYIQALEIVQEMVEMILEQPDKNDFYMSWSG